MKKRFYQKKEGKKVCKICGRARGMRQMFGQCRICLRESAHSHRIPGLEKSPH